MIYIYALIDPFTEEIRYIGKSIRPQGRLADHCHDQAVNHRTNWIKQLKSQGERPQLRILQELEDEADWQSAEREWIAKGHAAGWPLTNGTSGGDGVHDLPPESRERIARAWIGRKHRPDSLEKIGKASRGRHHTKEHRQRMHDLFAGREFSTETRQRISQNVRKLTGEQIDEIKTLLLQKVDHARIADKYGVDKGTVSNIKRGLFYQDVEYENPLSTLWDGMEAAG